MIGCPTVAPGQEIVRINDALGVVPRSITRVRPDANVYVPPRFLACSRVSLAGLVERRC